MARVVVVVSDSVAVDVLAWEAVALSGCPAVILSVEVTPVVVRFCGGRLESRPGEGLETAADILGAAAGGSVPIEVIVSPSLSVTTWPAGSVTT